ncbi:MAG: isochorismatase family protein [Planctomycetaceae bacterium]|nr:isochorismatase family protein [Planctomycetaceae bacterium]
MSRLQRVITGCLLLALATCARAGEPGRVYHNTLRPIENPAPLLADHPEYVQPIEEVHRFEAPALIDEPGAELDVRAWRFSYNARGIIEIPNRLDGEKTAIVVVHPWGIDDSHGWVTPEPAGVAFFCTKEKNALAQRHAADVINPFLNAHRGQVKLVLYSLSGQADPIRTKLYRTIDGTPTAEERAAARQAMQQAFADFDYRAAGLPQEIMLASGKPVIDYLRAFPGLDASPTYDPAGFWDLPIPVMDAIDADDDDVVLFDQQGYPALRDFLKAQGIEHVLVCGYATDMCVCKTTAGYENLRQDFNTFLVGDATLATFPANTTPAYATNQALSYAALNLLITQASWVRQEEGRK